MHSTHPTSYLQAAQAAADQARSILRSQTPTTINYKSDRDKVTDLDVRVERALKRTLAEHTPEAGFLGEETGGSLGGLTWVVDPIDGTANFTHGLPLIATSLALLENGEPLVALVDLPLLDTRYHAALDSGAYRDAHRIRVSDCTSLNRAIVALGDYATGPNAARRNHVRLQITAALAARVERIRMLGTAALDLVWVAEGLLDASVMLSNKPWDTAAGALIAREAGAVLMDTAGQRHRVDSAATIACSPRLTEELISAISATPHSASPCQ